MKPLGMQVWLNALTRQPRHF